jgi:hypothetical protein
MTLHDAHRRIRVEFVEMPGLKLTLAQIARLCGVPRELCEPAVSLLVNGGFLAATPDGSFLRRGLMTQPDAPLAPRALVAAS